MNLRIVLVSLSLLAIPALASAGTPTPVAPVGMGCVLTNVDSCSNGPWTSLSGAYAFGVSGSFSGTSSMTVSGGSVSRTITCSGTMVGGVMFPGSCVQSGAFPPANVPITIACSSVGTGTVACTIEGA